MRSLSKAVLALSVWSIAWSAAPEAGAQQAASVPGRSYVQVVRLKPDMVNEWRDLQKNEVIPAQKKAGVASRTTVMTQVGNAFEYMIVTPFPTWAAMDGPAPLTRALGEEGAAQLNAKLRKCIQSQSSYIGIRRDSLSIPAADAPVWRVAIRRAIPGKLDDYLAYYRSDVLPGMRKAKEAGKIAGSTVATRGAGAPSGEFSVITYYTKFADLDGGDPLVQVLGREEAARINEQANLYSTPTQVVIRRRIAELSY